MPACPSVGRNRLAPVQETMGFPTPIRTSHSTRAIPLQMLDISSNNQRSQKEGQWQLLDTLG
jgi:hypothetical protein